MKVLIATQRIINAGFANTEKSTIFILGFGKLASLAFLLRLSGTQYARAATVGISRRPLNIRRVFLQPVTESKICISGPTATVPTPLPAAAIPLAKARFLQSQEKEQMRINNQFSLQLNASLIANGVKTTQFGQSIDLIFPSIV